MGKKIRPKPDRLAEKLLQIRFRLKGKPTQEKILELLELEDVERDRISKYERGTLEPPLYILLRYSKLANVWMDVLVDDNLDLPKKIPSKKRSGGIKRKT